MFNAHRVMLRSASSAPARVVQRALVPAATCEAVTQSRRNMAISAWANRHVLGTAQFDRHKLEEVISVAQNMHAKNRVRKHLPLPLFD